MAAYTKNWAVIAGAAFLLGSMLAGAAPVVPAAVAEAAPDDALSIAFAEAFGTDLKRGYTLRADSWGGDLPVGETKPIPHQFFKGNEYHFYIRTEVPGAKVSVHIYDKDGNLAESRCWQKQGRAGFLAGAELQPRSTGGYFLIVKVDQSPEPRTAWAMAYAYK